MELVRTRIVDLCVCGVDQAVVERFVANATGVFRITLKRPLANVHGKQQGAAWRETLNAPKEQLETKNMRTLHMLNTQTGMPPTPTTPTIRITAGHRQQLPLTAQQRTRKAGRRQQLPLSAGHCQQHVRKAGRHQQQQRDD